MSRSRQRADRIRAEVPLDTVLETLGYDVVSGSDREQQFSCDLHGDGSDGKPSARYYPESTSWYCFACGRSRDAINTVMEKQGSSFSEACKALEIEHNLPPLPWKDDAEPKQGFQAVIKEQDDQPTVEHMRHTLTRLLDGLTKDGTFSLEVSLKLWEAFDRIVYMHQENMVADAKVRKGFERIAGKAMTATVQCES